MQAITGCSWHKTRLLLLLDAGYPEEAAECLADSTVDLHQAVTLMKRGCPGGFGLMPELGFAPVYRYLPPREPKPLMGLVDARSLIERGLASLASPLIRR